LQAHGISPYTFTFIYILDILTSVNVIGENAVMPKRNKPQGCCSLRPVRPLSKARSQKLAAMLKALADPTRFEIMRIVAAQSGPVCACDIVDRFDLSQPTISHHLKILSNTGLLTSQRSGLWSFFAPDPDGIERIGELGSLLSASSS
jgi:ArsR family transcriptional regulator